MVHPTPQTPDRLTGPAPAEPLPITALGVQDSGFWFLAADGTERLVLPAGMVDEATLTDLCGGQAWLRRNFPGQYRMIPQRSGGALNVAVGIDADAAGRHLARCCVDAELQRITPLPRGTNRVSAWTRFRARLRDWLTWFQGVTATSS